MAWKSLMSLCSYGMLIMLVNSWHQQSCVVGAVGAVTMALGSGTAYLDQSVPSLHPYCMMELGER